MDAAIFVILERTGNPVRNGTPEVTPASANLGNQTKPCSQLAAATMWNGSHLVSIEAGTLGEFEGYPTLGK